MKLLQKTTRSFLWVVIPILAFSGVGLFFLIRNIQQDEVDENLQHVAEQIAEEMKQGAQPQNISPIFEVQALSADAQNTLVFRDRAMPDPIEGDGELFREVELSTHINGEAKRLVLRTSLVEKADMAVAIGGAILGVFLILLITLLLLQRNMNKAIWAPFYKVLDQMKGLRLSQEEKLQHAPTKIEEFQQLQEGVAQLWNSAQKDYAILKAFTENAAHEMQTPLAVIQAKIELLMQDEKLSEQELSALEKIYQQTHLLSRMNKALLLLAKIAQQQYQPQKQQVANSIRELLPLYQEMGEEKDLHWEVELEEEVYWMMHEDLGKVLLQTLLQNAVRYTPKGGSITLTLSNISLQIANTAKGEALPPQIFERFHKVEQHPESLGLGLSIAREISEAFGYQLFYDFQGEKHIFLIKLA